MSNLTRYGQTALDKTFPDADESVFGHMVLELGMSPDEATQNLRPWVRDLDRSAELSKKTAYVAAFIGAGAGLATAATMGIGLTAILPLAAAAYNFFAGQQSAREQGVRESEYLLLKTCPELLKLIYALTQKGMPKQALVECYDDLLGAFTMQFQQRASLGMSDELDHDIVRSFQEIVKQKCEAESLARAIVAETENFTFDTLYQSTDSKPESLPAASVATASPIGADTRLGAVELPASPAAQSAPSLNMNSGSKGFDWHRLNTEYNDFPHLFLLGKTGAGKSYVSDRLVRFLDGYCIVISPKKLPADFQGLQVVGLPYDYRAIHRALVALEKLMVEREAEMQQTGFTDFQPINVILDELPVSSSGCKDLELDLLKPLKTLIRAGRTSKIRLIILAQGAEVKALGIEGEGGLRDSLTYVYLKGFVEDHAVKSKIDISQIKYPCIIEGQIADTAFLARFIETYPAGLDLTGQAARTQDAKWCQDKGMIPGTPEHLERIFNQPAADHEAGEVEEDAIETVSALASVQSAFPTWKPKSQDVAAKIVDWMAEREGKTFLPSEVRNGIRLLKGDKTIDNDRVKKLLDLLTEKQFISLDESGRYVFQKADDYDW